ncbi:NUDIX domain-containing protein [Peribacillus frigoritolerans]|uniref:NUDIX domain-containing protein n=1 Tax=Peribacillus frigoritolerans TaxID=450367 RepID=UPI00345DB917
MSCGFIELGESTEDSARREIWEETGLHIGNLQLIEVFSGRDFFTKLPNGDEYFHVTIAYATKEIRSGILRPDGIETKKVDFFKPAVLPHALSARDQGILKSFMQRK